jgi:hypothetical protein
MTTSKNKSMKPFQIAFRFFTVLVFAALAAGCAGNSGNLLDKENVAAAAGFKVITPAKPNQQALLAKLPADKVTHIVYGGRVYYVLPDRANNQAYVGGPKQYGVYQQLRWKQEKDSTNAGSPPPDIQVVEVNEMNWGEWGGWDAVGGPDGMGWPGWY